MAGFIIGLFAGGLTGVFVMCLCTAAGQSDKKKTAQEKTNNFVGFGDTITKKIVILL